MHKKNFPFIYFVLKAICICLTTSRHHLIIVGYRCSDYFLQRRGWKIKAFTYDGFKSIHHLKQDYTKNHLKRVIFLQFRKISSTQCPTSRRLEYAGSKSPFRTLVAAYSNLPLLASFAGFILICKRLAIFSLSILAFPLLSTLIAK